MRNITTCFFSLPLLLGFTAFTQVLAQDARTTQPTVGIRSHPPRAVALTGATVIVDPKTRIEGATVLIDEGKVQAVGQDVEIPPGYETIDCNGDFLYPAWIEPMMEADFESEASGPSHWNAQVHPEIAMHLAATLDQSKLAQWRKAGFGAALVAPDSGIIKGQSCVITLDDQPRSVTLLRANVAQHIRLYPQRGSGGYPNSPMGAMALVRQVLSDASWYREAKRIAASDPSLTPPAYDAALEALQPLLTQQQLAIIDGSNELYAMRADRIAREFGLRAVIRGSGREYRRLSEIAASQRALLVPVDFPKPPPVESIADAADASLAELMHWYLAPENAARLHRAGVTFAFTADGLDSPNEFLQRVRLAVDHGLDANVALAALTTVPAELLGIDADVGTIEANKLANLIRASGDLLADETARIKETWIRGQRYEWVEEADHDLRGQWNLAPAGQNKKKTQSPLPPGLQLVITRKAGKWEARIRVPDRTEEDDEDVGDAQQTDEKTGKSKDSQRGAADNKSAEERSSRTDHTASANEPDQQRTGKAAAGQSDRDKEKSSRAKARKRKTKNTEKKRAAQREPTSSDESSKNQADDGAKEPGEKPKYREAKLDKLQYAALALTGVFDAGAIVDGSHGKAFLHANPIRGGDEDLRLDVTIQWPDGSRVRLVGHRASEASEKSGESAGDDEKVGDDQSPEPANDAAEKHSDDKRQAPTKEPEKGTNEKEKHVDLDVDVVYPLGVYGRKAEPEQPEWVLIRGATIWTCGPAGVLEQGDLLVHRGVVQRVDEHIDAPDGAVVIDGRGKHVTPGIIDCHSHMATDGGVNESGQAVTAEVRIGDFIDPNDITIYRQLAGGVTAANILHGSANPIGGQNQVIKLRWGANDEAMKMVEAPAGIKFALGENVKQSNWSRPTGRYPQSRMGVEQIIRDRFDAALEYREQQRRWHQEHQGLPPRRDYELEAIAEILEGKRWIHCHSYRQDEILMILRVLEDYGVTIGSLQHILEGYKVADAMARHGATGSTFSDWWAYKFEVYDAIPYNGALMHRAGVIVSFNSDDRELARHLNHEAAKAVKYGGVAPEEALKFVTLNPAKQLRIDRWVGSLEPGKHADFVIWSGPPLSTMSVCLQTWIDGRKYFDRDEDHKRRHEDEQLRQQLIQLVIRNGAKPRSGPDDSDPSQWWARHDEFCHHVHVEDELHE